MPLLLNDHTGERLAGKLLAWVITGLFIICMATTGGAIGHALSRIDRNETAIKQVDGKISLVKDCISDMREVLATIGTLQSEIREDLKELKQLRLSHNP